MLIPYQLLLLLKIFNNLAQGLFKYLNLPFQSLNLLLLQLASLIILVNGPKLKHVCSLSLLVFLQQPLLLSLAVVQRVPLRHSLLCQLLVLKVNVLLDIEDI
jgi:hypothetical protein